MLLLTRVLKTRYCLTPSLPVPTVVTLHVQMVFVACYSSIYYEFWQYLHTVCALIDLQEL